MDIRASKKIKSVDQLAETIAGLKKKGKKVVQCHGVFDLLHLGHIRHFNLAKKEGDALVVTLTKDEHVKRGPGRPVFNEELRAEAIASLEIVDYVAVIDSPTAIECILLLKPDVYVKGSDYKAREKDVTGKIFDEEEAVRSVGGRLAFTDDITFSSSELINHYLNVYPPETMKYLKAIGKRYSVDHIAEKLDGLKKLRVLVVGDAIIDKYHYCEPMGKSSKEHLVANKHIDDEMFAGGALATANNVASVCGEVDLVTVLGSLDSHDDFISKKLSGNVRPKFFYRGDTCTTLKRRYVNNGDKKKLFEICHLKDDDIPEKLENEISEHLKKTCGKYDLVIVADFGHGLLTRRLINLICSKAKYLALNVQTNSANIGFNLVTKYPKGDCVCIDEMELRYATHDRFSDLKTILKKIYGDLSCKNIIVTRGSNGSLGYTKGEGFHKTPAFSYRVVDAIGAGDAFFAFVGPCYAMGYSQDLVSFIGNVVGSLAVQIICNREPVKFVDMVKFITRLLK
jgi:rfaE bifunctional protein nucleotidyltransferase chain/domain